MSVVFQAIFSERNGTFYASFDSVIEVDKHFEAYEGPYNVIPQTVSQTLETNGKLMQDDVTVEEIPYAETSNIYGTTVVIAS